MILLAAALLQSAPVAPRPPRALNAMAEAFATLCIEGRPDQRESTRRALATGWREVPGQAPPPLPPGQRLSVMRKADMIFITTPPLPGAPNALGCQIGANFPSILPLDMLAGALSSRLALGPPSYEPFGSRPAAIWRLAPDFRLVVTAPPGNGPRTHQYMAITELEPSP